MDGVVKKLIFRHPHVFGSAAPEKDAESVLVSWDAIKRREKHQRTTAQAMDSVARSLPALWRAEKLQNKGGRRRLRLAGYSGSTDQAGRGGGRAPPGGPGRAPTWPRSWGRAVCRRKGRRFAGVDPEDALNAACEKFIRRYAAVEQGAADRGVPVSDLTLAEMTDLWNGAKQRHDSDGF